MEAIVSKHISATLNLAYRTNLYSKDQQDVLAERCNSFAEGKLLDDYEVYIMQSSQDIVGFVCFRKRTLTEAAYEISHLGAETVADLQNLLLELTKNILNRNGRIIFAEFPDTPNWSDVSSTLQKIGFSIAGHTPHLIGQNLGTRHYVAYFPPTSTTLVEPTYSPKAHQKQQKQTDKSLNFTMTVLPSTQVHKDSILRITTETTVFTQEDLGIVDELLNEYFISGTSSGYIFLSCMYDNNLVGYVCFGSRASTSGTYDIYWICTDPSYRRLGVGRRLMAEVELSVIEKGGYLLVLETSDSIPFTPTRKFYDSIGYMQTVHIPDFYSSRDGLVVYAKYLKTL